MNLEKLNGLYLKFYFTENKNLPTLLKNDGSVIVLSETVDSSKYEGTIIKKDTNTNTNNINSNDNIPVYSIWVGGEKIMSGYGLLPTSLDDMQAIISNMHTKINACATQSYADDKLVLREPSNPVDSEYEDTAIKYFDSNGNIIEGSKIFDSRANISNTYFKDEHLLDDTDTMLYVKSDSMYYYVKAIYDKLSAPPITVNNMSYNITYVDNKYSIDQKTTSTYVALTQEDTIIPLPLYSIIKAISTVFTIDNLDPNKEYNGTLSIIIGSNIAEPRTFDITCSNVTNQTFSLLLDISSDGIYTKSFIDEQKTTQASLVLNESGTNTEVLSVSFPSMSFFQYDIPMGYIIKTTGRENMTPYMMYKISNDCLFYDYDLTLENASGELFNESPYDRLYLLVKDSYQINELYVKIFYKDKHDAVKSYKDMTDVTYRYNKKLNYTHTYAGASVTSTYNGFGINVEDILVDEIQDKVDRIVFKAIIGPNDVDADNDSTLFAKNNWEYNAKYPTSSQTNNYNSTFSWKINTQTGRYNANDSNVTLIYDPVVLSWTNPVDRPIIDVLNDKGYTGKEDNYYGDEITASEIRTITTIGQFFHNNKSITDFDKFKYFINLVEFSTFEKVFMGCENLKTIILPYLTHTQGQTSIPGRMFSDCTSLEYVGMQDFITHIGGNAFNGCTNLKYIDLSHISGLYDRVFYNCSSLEHVNLSNLKELVVYDGNGNPNPVRIEVFRGCTSLRRVTMPVEDATSDKNITNIGRGYFRDCKNLTTISIPSSVETIHENAFNGCELLNKINFNNTTTLKTIGNYAFQDCKTLSKNYKNTVINGIVKEVDTNDLVIPESVKSIGVGAFYGCTKLAEITLPTNTNFTNINNIMFYGCTSLKSLITNNNIYHIDEQACKDCSGLASITIGANVKNIYNEAFSGCGALATITTHAAEAPILGNKVFYGVNSDNVELIIDAKNPNVESYEDWPGYNNKKIINSTNSTNYTQINYNDISTNTATNTVTNAVNSGTETDTNTSTTNTSTNTVTNTIDSGTETDTNTSTTNTSTNTVTNAVNNGTETDTTETSTSTNTSTNTVDSGTETETTEGETETSTSTNTSTNTVINTVDSGTETDTTEDDAETSTSTNTSTNTVDSGTETDTTEGETETTTSTTNTSTNTVDNSTETDTTESETEISTSTNTVTNTVNSGTETDTTEDDTETSTSTTNTSTNTVDSGTETDTTEDETETSTSTNTVTNTVNSGTETDTTEDDTETSTSTNTSTNTVDSGTETDTTEDETETTNTTTNNVGW